MMGRSWKIKFGKFNIGVSKKIKDLIVQLLPIITQEGYIEELSILFYLDTALLKSCESILSET